MYRIAISIGIIEDECGVIISTYLPFIPAIGQSIEYIHKGIMYIEKISEVTICLDEFDNFIKFDVTVGIVNLLP